MKKELLKLREKASQLTAKLTLEEKIGMIHGAELFRTKGVDRLGIPPLSMSDGPMGVRQQFKPDSWEAIGTSSDYVTYLPSNSAIASTWNRDLAYASGQVLGEEARGRGKDVILGPGINIKRSPLCGRNFEYFSEDPYLVAEMAVPYIKGVQENDVAACVKHFAANNQETERLWVDDIIDEKTLRKIYLPAFYAAVTKGDSYSLMTAYNLINGTHCYANKHLLQDILREEWGYEGTIISDWGGVHDTDMAAGSPLDIEMSVTYDFDDYFMANPLLEKVKAGQIDEKLIDEKVTHILMLMMRLHMIAGAEDDRPRKAGAYNTADHQKKALDTARESVVLLKNEEGLLPLDRNKVKKLLVIGENADIVHSNGGGSAEIKALYEITPLMGLSMVAGGNTEVTYVPGYKRDPALTDSDKNWQEASLEDGGGSTKTTDSVDQALAKERQTLREEAVKLASEYDQVIIVAGLNHNYDVEGQDRSDMKLPYEQDELIEQVLEVNPDTVVVIMAGSPVEMGRFIDKAKALVWHWYSGMEGGRALAEVIFGDINPSGKLPETFYKTHTDCSAHVLGEFPGDKSVSYGEGLFVGYRYNDKYDVAPQFCFGHGLSYTTFSYEAAALLQQPEGCAVSLKVKNEGLVAGKEIVQVYLAPADVAEDEPLQELVGFEKLALEPGETKTVEIKLERTAPGTLRIGASSRDIRLEVQVK